jgi:hypothetical protein
MPEATPQPPPLLQQLLAPELARTRFWPCDDLRSSAHRGRKQEYKPDSAAADVVDAAAQGAGGPSLYAPSSVSP